MVATTNTMALVANNIFPTCNSGTTNLSPIIPSTVVRVPMQVIANQQINFTLNQPIQIHNRPQTAAVFNRVPNYVPMAYVPPPAASIIGKAIDFPIIDNARGAITNSSWTIPASNKQGPLGVPSTYQVVQDYPNIAAVFTYASIPSPNTMGITIQDNVNQAISVEQNIWKYILRKLSQLFVVSISDAIGTVTESIKKKAILKAIAEADGSATDSVTKTKRFIRTITDALGSVTEAVKKKAILKAIAEGLGSITESITKKAIPKAIVETITVSETVVKTKRFIRTITDALGTVTEAIKKKSKSVIAETITVSESVKKKAVKAINEAALSISDILLTKKLVLINKPDSLLAACGNVPTSLTSTIYYTMAGAVSDGVLTESFGQSPYRLPGTFSHLWYSVETNGKAQTLTTTLRKNAADANQTISIGSTATGTFTDSTHTDIVAAADKFDVKFPFTAAGTFTLSIRALTFVAITNTVTRTGKDNYTTYVTASQTSYCRLIGDNATPNLTESISKLRQRKAMSIQNCLLNVFSNTNTNTVTWKSRKNGVDGNLVVSISASTTGYLEDTSHSDSVVAGDDFNYSFTTGTGTVNIEIDEVYTDFVSTAGDSIHSAGADSTITQTAAITYYQGLSNGLGVDTVESGRQTTVNSPFTFSEFLVNIDSNSVSSTSTSTLRANAAATACTVSITGSTAGLFGDSTHTYSAVSTDKVNYQLAVGATGTSLTIRSFSVWTHMPAANTLNIISIVEAFGTVSETVKKKAVKAIAEALGLVTESIKKKAIPKAIVETITVSDSVVKIHRFIRTITDALGTITDSIKKKAKPTNIVETITVSDAVKKKAILKAIVESALTVSETVVKVKRFIRTVTDALGTVTESVKEKAIKSIAETLTVSEAVKKKAIKSIAETITVSESVKKKAILKTIAETLGSVTESVVKVHRFIRTISQTVTVSESVKKKAIPTITLTAITVSESVKKKAIKSIAEGLGSITESIVKIKRFIRTISETVTVSESVKKKAIKVISESLGTITESIKKKAIKYIAEGGNKWAISFSRASGQQYIAATNALLTVGITAGSEASYSCWFRMPSAIAGNASALMSNGFGMEPNVSNTGELRCDYNFNSHAADYPTTGIVVTDGKWHHVVCSNKATGNSQVYLDGVKYVDDVIGDYLFNNGQNFRIGSMYGFYFFTGQIDEPRVYNVQLTQAEVTALNAGVNITRGLVAWWNFDEGSGTTVTDSVNGIIGTLTNSPTWYNTTLPLVYSISDVVKKKAIKAIAETLTVTESVKKKAIKSIAETLTVSESVVKIKRLIRTITDAIGTITDSVKKKAIKAIAEADGTATESISKVKRFIRTIAESLGTITDSVKKKAILKAIIETIAVSESLVRVKRYVRTIVDVAETVSDSVKKKAIKFIGQPILSVSDNVVAVFTTLRIRNITDALGAVTESVKKKAKPKNIAEADGSITESVSKIKRYIRIISETVVLGADSVKKKTMKIIIEPITVTESVKKKFITRIIEPALSVSDSIVKHHIFVRIIIEPLIETTDFINMLKGGAVTGLNILRHIGSPGIHRHRKGREL